MFQSVTVKRLSLCDCGFPILAEHIGIGATYIVDMDNWKVMTLCCGGCKGKILIDGVKAQASSTGHAGILPKAIFEEIN